MHMRYFFAAAELCLLLLFIIPLPVVNIGNIFGMAVSVLLLAMTLRWNESCRLIGRIWSSTPGKLGLSLLGAAIIAGAAFVAVLSVNMYSAMKNAPQQQDILIVLGCKVKGDRPSKMLARRLDAAYDYMCENSEVLCIVSGGKGADEDISEAEAMKRYLEEKGIAPERIIIEDRSVSTEENLRFSMEIIESLGLEPNVTIVTDGFHQYRASLLAKKNGAEEIHAVSADTNPRYVPMYWVREWFGLAELMLLKR